MAVIGGLYENSSPHSFGYACVIRGIVSFFRSSHTCGGVRMSRTGGGVRDLPGQVLQPIRIAA